MASKVFVLCALVCAIQGLNAAIVRPSLLPVQSVESNLFEDSMSQFQSLEAQYSEIIDNFENVVLNTESEAPEAEFAGLFDDVMEPFYNFDGNDMAEEGVDMDVVRKCIEEQRHNMQKFSEEMRAKVIEARETMRKLIVQTFTPYIKEARQALSEIAKKIREFPMEMWECIKEHNVLKAIELVRNTRKFIAEKANQIAKAIRDARSQFPMIRDLAMKIREQLRKDAADKMMVIREEIRQCIINGSKSPLPAVSGEHVSTLVAPEEQVSNLIVPADAVYEA